MKVETTVKKKERAREKAKINGQRKRRRKEIVALVHTLFKSHAAHIKKTKR